MNFAYKAKLNAERANNGQLPVLFVIDAVKEVKNYQGKIWTQKAFLHNEALSAHPEEEEVLLYASNLKVQDIKSETHPPSVG